MKRILLHTLFWLCYFAQFAYISFLWDKDTFSHWPTGQLLIASFTASFLYIIPQVLFLYYIIYHGINNIIKKKRSFGISIVRIAVALFVCIIADRLISNYISLPYLYKSPQFRAPLLEIKRVFLSLWYIGFAFGLMLAVKTVRNQLTIKETEKNLLKEKLETELKFLKNQTNPHFLLNTLNNIYALARKKSEDTPEAVMRLSELLRFMLYQSSGKLIQLRAEIRVLEDYLALETLRYNERLVIGFQKHIDSNTYQISPFLLLPFLENAFKHGISETRFESFIHIRITVSNNLLIFEIENSKDSCENKESVANIGLMNVKRRLELTYSDYKLEVKNERDVFIVKLSVNLTSYVEI